MHITIYHNKIKEKSKKSANFLRRMHITKHGDKGIWSTSEKQTEEREKIRRNDEQKCAKIRLISERIRI